MNESIRAKLENWLQRTPADPLTNVIDGNISTDDQSADLRKALAVLGEARAAFEASKLTFVQNATNLAAAKGKVVPDLPAMRSSAAIMSEAGHATLGHYLAVVQAAEAVGPLAGLALGDRKRAKEMKLAALRSRLTKALTDLGFEPNGRLWPALFNQGVTKHPLVSIAQYVDTHPEVMPLAVELLAATAYGTCRFEVSAAAQKAAQEAAALLMEIEGL